MKGILAFLLLATTAFAAAEPQFLEEFVKKYAPKSNLKKLECKICHTNPPERNPYGIAVREAMRDGGRKPFSMAILTSVEGADSDGDGKSNLDEITADSAPGVANPSAPADPAPAASEASGGLIPKHGFHPTLVHFPIALFLFGAFLEILGWRKSDDTQRKAGWWCILGGTAGALASAASGLIAFNLNGYAWEPGPALTHFLLAVSSTILMIGVTLWRKKGAHTSQAYFALLILTAILVGVAGHFGGNLVYN